MASGFDTLLTADEARLRVHIRSLLGDLREALSESDGSAEDRETVRRAERDLDELFLLVIAGEFNAGKSAFINALLGAPVLAEGVTPTTTRVQILRHQDAVTPPAEQANDREWAVDTITAAAEVLRHVAIVDTPGTNAIRRDHEAITREFVPRSDLVLFVTSADRPFTETERAFLETIRDWGKKIVVVVNKVDLLRDAVEIETVRSFIADNARSLLGIAPSIHFVSARQALRAKTQSDASSLEESGFVRLEAHLAELLAPAERVRLKLASPLGVAVRVAGSLETIAEQRLATLAADVRALDDIDGQLAIYRQDMAREFRFRLADVENVLHEFERRGVAFLDDTMRLGRLLSLLQSERLKAEFSRVVVADLPVVVERRVGEVIDWMVAADLRQWQAVQAHIAERRQVHADRLVGQSGAFDLDRARLLATIGGAARDAVETYDRDTEANRLVDGLRSAVASTALVEVGALGLGAVVAQALAGAAADATGVLAASVVAVLGLFILPGRREAAKRELRQRIVEMRRRLQEALTEQFDRELLAGVNRIAETVAPYTRFVRAERVKLETTRAKASEIGARASALAAPLRQGTPSGPQN